MSSPAWVCIIIIRQGEGDPRTACGLPCLPHVCLVLVPQGMVFLLRPHSGLAILSVWFPGLDLPSHSTELRLWLCLPGTHQLSSAAPQPLRFRVHSLRGPRPTWVSSLKPHSGAPVGLAYQRELPCLPGLSPHLFSHCLYFVF